MSLLFDQNLSRRLPILLADLFPGSAQVSAVGLATADDQTIWNYAAAHGLTIVSKDSDFLPLANRLGIPPRLLWLRIGNGPTREIEALIRARAAEIQAFLSSPSATVLELP